MIHLLYFCVMWLNATPKPNGLLDQFFLRELILRLCLDFNKHFRGDFSEYIQAHEDPDVTNDMKERTHNALYLGPTGNLQGLLRPLTSKRVVSKRIGTSLVFPCLIQW